MFTVWFENLQNSKTVIGSGSASESCSDSLRVPVFHIS